LKKKEPASTNQNNDVLSLIETIRQQSQGNSA